MKIYKFGPFLAAPQVHRFVRPLKVMVQNNQVYLWALVSSRVDDCPNKEWQVVPVVTGAEFPGPFQGGSYVDSVQFGPFVIHLLARLTGENNG